MQTLTRVLFKAHDNGQLFPVYFNDTADIPDAAAKLNAVEVERRPATEIDLLLEQLTTIGQWSTNRLRV